MFTKVIPWRIHFEGVSPGQDVKPCRPVRSHCGPSLVRAMAPINTKTMGNGRCEYDDCKKAWRYCGPAGAVGARRAPEFGPGHIGQADVKRGHAGDAAGS
ncbi:hypothetical protein CENSYa_0893 [Cenarchaeum symbiosum A]|uniref:Uncharacterized protein n=1 Tax=Cenarchaeum symbiosum (strain A) TaxID=414004 RepID=A0RW08_CENSY|nr:hypothetical protein CENSYa_0893 [Cenarchaeum symbiosum A]